MKPIFRWPLAFFISFLFGLCPVAAQNLVITETVRIDTQDPVLLNAIEGGDQFGQGISAMQDLDGDGVQEVLVGASFDDDGGPNVGAVYVLFMNSDHTVKKYNKIIPGQGALTAMTDFSGLFGGFVTSLGDINGDDIDDIAVGEPRSDAAGTRVGRVWIIFLNEQGEAKGFNTITYGDPNFAPTPPGVDIRFGTQICDIGDLNGDLIPDIAVGEGFSTPGNTGAIYIIFLNSDGSVKGYQRITNNSGGLPSILNSGDNFGISLTAIGDINGDNIVDLAVGARYDDDGITDAGAVYTLFLNRNGTVKGYNKISATAGMDGLLDRDDRFGISVNTIGDVNKDGINDLIVGAYRDDDGGTDKGAIYLLLLNQSGGIKAATKYSMTEGGFSGDLDSEGDFGWTVSSFRDNDKNGFPEFIVSAYKENIQGVDDGAFYILSLDRLCQSVIAQAGSDVQLCSVQDYSFSAVLPQEATGKWTLVSGSGTLQDVTSPTSAVSGLQPGSNIFEWRIVDVYGCEASDQVEVFVRNDQSNAGPDQVTCEPSASLGATLDNGGSGTWTVLEGSGAFDNTNDPYTVVRDLQPGSNVFQWTMRNRFNCVVSDLVEVVYDVTVAEAGENQVVCGSSAILAGELPSGYTGKWELVSGSGVLADENNPATQVTGLSAGNNTFKWRITSPLGCVNEDMVTLYLFYGGDVTATAVSCSLQDYQVSINTGDGSDYTDQGRWLVEQNGVEVSQVDVEGEGARALIRNLPYGEDTILFELEGDDCVFRSERIVNVKEPFIPNVITPNGDPYNEYFIFPEEYVVVTNRLTIYNRWGKVVYDIAHYTNSFNGANLPSGAYYYEFSSALCEEAINGWIQVLK